MTVFTHKPQKHKSGRTYMCEADCGRYAVDKAVDYEEMKTKPQHFREVDRHYWCGSHRKAGTITHSDGTVDPSDFESISDTDDYSGS